jgi:lysophospholipase L1-like esterase
MRISLALVSVAVIAIGVAALAIARDEPASGDSGSVTLVGDSLNLGIEPYLREELDGWGIDVHDRVGRTTAEGLEEMRALGEALAPVVVVSLGTNDSEGSEEEFRALVEQAVALAGPGRCVVWATIVRDGAPRAGFDEVLREAASDHANVRLLDWAAMVSRDDALLAFDRVHATPDGYARRAQETARTVRACDAAAR